MNIGIVELLLVCGITSFLLLGASMIAGVVLVVTRRMAKPSSPLAEELKQRYERGELSQQQYQAMMKELV